MFFFPSGQPYWKLGLDLWRVSVEAQMIIGMRMAGMAGMWTLAPGETTRMVLEKQDAFSKGFAQAGASAMGGQRPDQIMQAALQPVKRRTSTNSRRLCRSMRRQMW